MDAELVCRLTRRTTPIRRKTVPWTGHALETFGIFEVLKGYMGAGANPCDLWFCRDSKKREIDLAIREGHALHPTETKTSAMVGTDTVSNLNRLEAIEGPEVGFGHVICQTQEPHYDIKDDHVWLVYDKDNFSDEEFGRVAACCAQTRELATYHALWSNPCFELWLLAHLRYTTTPMDSYACCNTLNDMFKKEFGISYSKSMDGVFDMLAGLRNAAMDNVARLHRHHAGIGNESPSSQRPCTNVDALFDVMGEFLPLGGGGSGIGSR